MLKKSCDTLLCGAFKSKNDEKFNKFRRKSIFKKIKIFSI